MKMARVLVVPFMMLLSTGAFADEDTEGLPLYQPNDIVTLLNDPKVKKELRIARYQEATIKAGCDRWKSRESSDELAIEKMKGPDTPAKVRALSTQRANELFRSLGLSASQLKRLKQILLQKWGVAIFNFPEIQKALAIDDDQFDSIEEVRDELFEEVFLQLGDNKIRQAEADRRISELSKTIHPRIREQLNASQRKVLDELIGTSYHFVLN